LLFMLLVVALQDGVTIVIVPIVVLRQDMCKCSNKKGIPCTEWDSKRPLYYTRIILAILELAAILVFSRFIKEKKRAY
jgi:superfamily II DNA helicase RecQ